MSLYLLFVTMAALTVLSPGPGVVMTLSNALKFGPGGAIGGIFGIASGAFVVAAISATGLGVLLATSVAAFTLIKLLGALYLLYLGIRLWRAPPFPFHAKIAQDAQFPRRFLEGLTVQLTNPKAVFFFLSVFPQFITPAEGYTRQFLRLVLSYGFLVVVIHCAYALFAERVRSWIATERGGRLINRAAGTVFIAFGIALASARR